MLLLIYFYLFIVIVILLIVLAVVVAVKGYISRGGDFKLWGKRVLALRARRMASYLEGRQDIRFASCQKEQKAMLLFLDLRAKEKHPLC